MSESSRNNILQNLRSVLPQSAPLPDLPPTGPWQIFQDPVEQFSEVLTTVGGQCVQTRNADQANSALQEVEAWTSADVRCSFVPGIGDSTFDLNAITDPHDLENVDFAVLPGIFAVAENGAIWVTDQNVPHRVLYFLPQHIAIVVSSSQIVHNMHEAYDRIQPQQHSFCGFVSGPSKTADIEQSLVIGAHGARSLTVLAVDELELAH